LATNKVESPLENVFPIHFFISHFFSHETKNRNKKIEKKKKKKKKLTSDNLGNNQTTRADSVSSVVSVISVLEENTVIFFVHTDGIRDGVGLTLVIVEDGIKVIN
jgi:hypothetical protein